MSIATISYKPRSGRNLAAVLSAFSVLGMALGLVISSQTVHAQSSDPANFPNGQTITLVMPFPAGSGVDVVARLMQESLQKSLKTNIVIDYKVGAAGNISSEIVARSKPDGLTVMLATAATHGVNAALYKKLSFDVEADFTPLGTIVDVSNVLMINASVIDVNTAKEFIDKVKAEPGKYNYASTGNGTGTHLAFAEFNARAGLNMVHVPYKGGPEATQAVLKGEVCCVFSQVQAALPHYRAGKVRLLGVSTPQKVAVVSEVPTIAESALPGFASYIWFGIMGPKGMNALVAQRWNGAIKEALDNPELRQKLNNGGNTPRYETIEQFRTTVKKDRATWAAVVKDSGATID
jgi:tripartite-type tricarboxylate transporter receptor subunit TctC